MEWKCIPECLETGNQHHLHKFSQHAYERVGPVDIIVQWWSVSQNNFFRYNYYYYDMMHVQLGSNVHEAMIVACEPMYILVLSYYASLLVHEPFWLLKYPARSDIVIN
jgi:hypothetical protein